MSTRTLNRATAKFDAVLDKVIDWIKLPEKGREVQPIEVEKALCRAAHEEALIFTASVIIPNRFEVRLNPETLEKNFSATLVKNKIAKTLKDHITTIAGIDDKPGSFEIKYVEDLNVPKNEIGKITAVFVEGLNPDKMGDHPEVGVGRG